MPAKTSGPTLLSGGGNLRASSSGPSSVKVVGEVAGVLIGGTIGTGWTGSGADAGGSGGGAAGATGGFVVGGG
jgi:hypothetical protein